MMQPYLSQAVEPEDDDFDYHYDLPGSAPGTLQIDPDAHPTQVVLIDYNCDRATRKSDVAPFACLPYLEQDSVSWIDVRGLGTESVLTQVGAIFALHPLLLEDVVNVPQRPKVESYRQHLAIVAQTAFPMPTEKGFELEQVSLILGGQYLLTFQEDPSRDSFKGVRDRLRSKQSKLRELGTDYLAYALVDTIVDNFFPILEAYGDRIEELEDEVILNPTPQTLTRIYQVRRRLLSLRRAIWPLRSIMDTLVRGDSPLVSSEVTVYFRDCYDHVAQLLEIVESYRELASSLMEVYLSSASNRMNEVMKILTVISSIFIPLSFIAGLYGMNFENIPALSWQWGYFVCLAAMVAIASSMAFFFWRRGWFQSLSVAEIDEEK